MQGPSGVPFETLKKPALPRPSDLQNFNPQQSSIREGSPSQSHSKGILKLIEFNFELEEIILKEKEKPFHFEKNVEEQESRSQKTTSFSQFELEKEEAKEIVQDFNQFANFGEGFKKEENLTSFDDFSSTTTVQNFNPNQASKSQFEDFKTSNVKFDGFGQWETQGTSNFEIEKQSDFTEFSSFQQTSNVEKTIADFGDFSSFPSEKNVPNQNENFDNFGTFNLKSKDEETKESQLPNLKIVENNRRSIEAGEQSISDQNQFDMEYNSRGNIENQEFSFLQNQNDPSFSSGNQESGSRNRLSHSRTIDLNKLENIKSILDDLTAVENIDINETSKIQEVLNKMLQHFYQVK